MYICVVYYCNTILAMLQKCNEWGWNLISASTTPSSLWQLLGQKIIDNNCFANSSDIYGSYAFKSRKYSSSTIITIESVDSISRDEQDAPLMQYITKA